jgi:hypothetical protein
VYAPLPEQPWRQRILRPPRTLVRKVLLICGLLAPLLYVGSDILAGMSWEGYSFTSQAVSELRGIGAPTRAFLILILFIYAVLEIAFGSGIWKAAGRKRALRTAGALLIGLGVLDLMGPLFAMNANETVGSVTNIIHILVTVLTVISILLIIGFGSTADGKWFRFYSLVTLLIVIVAGALTFLEIQRIAANLPTPWLGVKERINIYGYMLWMAMLAIVLLRNLRTREEVVR